MLNSKEILANNIKNLMKKNNKTREDVASAIDVKYTTFCDWAKGRTYPKMEYIIKIADYFEVKPYAITDNNPNYEKAYMEVFQEDFNVNNKVIEIFNYIDGKLEMKYILEPSIDLLKKYPNSDFLGLIIPDNSMNPKYLINDTVIVIDNGFTSNGDYLIENIKNKKINLRSININDNDNDNEICIYPLNPNNTSHDITRYYKKDDFYTKYRIIGKVKRHIRDFED